MNAKHGKYGSRAPGLLLGGLVAGALGLAFSAGASPALERSGASGDASGGYGLPSSDTGMSTAPSAPGTGSPSSTGLYGSGPGAASSLPPNISPGWKIRVCSEKTKADQIRFRFSSASTKTAKGASGMGTSGNQGASGMGGSGSGESSGSAAGSPRIPGSIGGSPSYPADDPEVNAALSEHTASWTRGEATEISLPTGLRDADRIRIEASPSQKDQDAAVCVIYNDHVAKKMMFDDKEVSMVKTTDHGECGC